MNINSFRGNKVDLWEINKPVNLSHKEALWVLSSVIFTLVKRIIKQKVIQTTLCGVWFISLPLAEINTNF